MVTSLQKVDGPQSFDCAHKGVTGDQSWMRAYDFNGGHKNIESYGHKASLYSNIKMLVFD